MSSQNIVTLAEDWLNVRDCGVSGSAFESRAAAEAGSNRIAVENAGDFQPGQGVMVSGCCVHYQAIDAEASRFRTSLKDALEFRGHPKDTHWIIFLLEIDGLTPLSFRWDDDLHGTWRSERVPITGEWQELSHGLQVRFRKHALEVGQLIVLHARDELFTTIESINGNTLVLADHANVTMSDAVVRHLDDAALQAAMDRAIQERRNIYLPTGLYRLRNGLTVQDATGITIAGANAEATVLDISAGMGHIFNLVGGTEVILRNLRLIGHTGRHAGSHCNGRQGAGGWTIWTGLMKMCRAMHVNGTERVLAENLHASRMSAECFYSQGPNREGVNVHSEQPDPVRRGYTREWTFLRCSVTDCNFNAFNNNDLAENTNILHCRVENIGGCAWEGPSRFIRFIGNTIRNAGCCSIGNMMHRLDLHDKLGYGQSVFADNVFEGHHSHGVAIRVQHGAADVIVRNNIFVNYAGTAVSVSGTTAGSHSFPSERVAVTGNIIDLTVINDPRIHRAGIDISASNVIVSDNQIFVRGDYDRKADGILIGEPAVNVTVHDNLIRNCHYGIAARRVQSLVADVVDNRTFKQYAWMGLPLECASSHCYRGWRVVWMEGASAVPSKSIIERFDPATGRFILTAPRNLRPGDSFEAYPDSANWSIHGNTIVSCRCPMDLDAYGSETSVIRDNILDRGEARNVSAAVVARGRFQILDNLLRGFDEPGSTSILSLPDRRLGCVEGRLYAGNRFIRCAVSESPAVAPLPARPAWRARKLTTLPRMDGTASDWPWDDAERTIAFEQDIDGRPVQGLRARAIAGWADRHLYLAAEFTVPPGGKLKVGQDVIQGDQMNMALRSASPERRGPVWLLWGKIDGAFSIRMTGGASREHLIAVKNATGYAAHASGNRWTCEWRIPLNIMEVDTDDGLRFNIGARRGLEGSMPWEDTGIVWAPTGEKLVDYDGWIHVDFAGDLHLTP